MTTKWNRSTKNVQNTMLNMSADKKGRFSNKGERKITRRNPFRRDKWKQKRKKKSKRGKCESKSFLYYCFTAKCKKQRQTKRIMLFFVLMQSDLRVLAIFMCFFLMGLLEYEHNNYGFWLCIHLTNIDFTLSISLPILFYSESEMVH